MTADDEVTEALVGWKYHAERIKYHEDCKAAFAEALVKLVDPGTPLDGVQVVAGRRTFNGAKARALYWDGKLSDQQFAALCDLVPSATKARAVLQDQPDLLDQCLGDAGQPFVKRA